MRCRWLIFSRLPLSWQGKYHKADESGNDSIWATIGSFSKWYRVSFSDVLYNISYANLILYGAVIPSLDGEEKGDKKKNVIVAQDPKNREMYLQLIGNMK